MLLLNMFSKLSIVLSCNVGTWRAMSESCSECMCPMTERCSECMDAPE